MHVRRSLAAALAVGSLLLAGCAGSDLSEGSDSPGADDSSAAADNGPVSISGQSFPEAALVAAMYDELLTNAGYDTDVKLVDTRDAYMATFPDSIDVVPEYVGGIVNFLNSRENGAKAQPFTAGDGAELATQGADLLDGAKITLLDQSAATDTNAFFVTKDYSESEGVTKLSDLKGKSVVLAAAPDCEGRLDCEGGLSDKYGIDITKVLPLGYASDQTYQSVIKGEAQLGETSTTDGTLESQGLVVLEDDMQIQPAQNLVPAVSSAFLEQHPDVADVLNGLMAALTTEDLTELNGEVAVDRKTPEEVAHSYLESAGLL
ncbi:glycine betaine ABC transporter substrate-binding protein [Nocardioides hankookensis]|uniref:ABC transporter substrate-binding protein n=1 Tax=Nocardioides hankookensis TaxID=443157 RepID=A0ABW1LDY2_9ACTN